MVTVDHNKNIQRIIDVIKADSSVFDNGSTPGLLREVNFGDPNNNDKKSINQKPAVYVTTRDSIQSTTYTNGASLPNNPTQITVEYEIVLLAISKAKTVDSQKQLYALMTNLQNLFKADPTFVIPPNLPNPGTDPIFSRSIVNQVPWDGDTKGQLITSISYVLTATIGTSVILDIPGIGQLPLLSIPTNQEGEEWDANRIQDGTRVITGKGDFGNIFAEYETSPSLDVSIRAKFDTEENIDIITNGVTRTVNVYYADRTITAPFDAISRAVLHLEIVQ